MKGQHGAVMLRHARKIQGRVKLIVDVSPAVLSYIYK